MKKKERKSPLSKYDKEEKRHKEKMDKEYYRHERAERKDIGKMNKRKPCKKV